MTVTLAYAPDQYYSDGVGNCTVTFPFDDSSELVVVSRVVATGAETTLVEDTHYSVTGGGGGTGTVTALNPATDFPAGNSIIWTISRSTPLTQETNYVEGDIFPADAHEEVADKITRIVQESSYQANRALRFPDSDDSALDAELPSSVDRANMSLGFDADGEPIALAGTVSGDVTVTGFMEGVLDDGSADDARATLVAQEDVVTTRGDLVVGDAAGDADRLAVGATAGHVLTTDGTDPDWAENPFPRGFISGLVTSNDDPPLGDDINVTAGACRDSADSYNMILTAEVTKRTDAIWDTGDDAGGMPNGLLAASTWYRVFLIMNPTTGDVEIGFDTSATAANLIADHSGSGGGDASGYTVYRQIGWFLTDATPHVYDFVQTGDQFHWQKAQGIPNSDSQVSVSVAGDTPSLVTIMCPPLHWCRIHATGVNGGGANNEIWITAVSPTSWAFADESEPLDVECFVYPDASSQIRTVGNDVIPPDDYDFSVDVLYFIYRRGKDA